MKYVLVTAADQTIAFLPKDESGITTVHKEAKIFDNLIKASTLASEMSAKDALYASKKNPNWQFRHPSWWVEEVEDVEEFIQREDTW